VVCGYYSIDEHTAVPDILLIGTAAWNRLSEPEKAWLQKAVDESVEHQKMLWKESTDNALRAVREAGVEILHPDKEPFRKAVQTIHDSYKGTPLYDLIREAREM
jgi:TRAP-type C4-dicarboxylate transport system substrate-binding protein